MISEYSLWGKGRNVVESAIKSRWGPFFQSEAEYDFLEPAIDQADYETSCQVDEQRGKRKFSSSNRCMSCPE